MQNETAKSARYYARRGLAVFPLEAASKRPVGALVPHGVLDASTDEAVIARWFDVEAHNIGVAMPPGVVVVDVDPRNGGSVTLEEWCIDHDDAWLDGPHAATGGGGLHYWFRYDGSELVKSIDGVDFVRGHKYVVAPPSVVRQPDDTMGPYRWIVPLPADLGDLPELPEWLLGLATPVPFTPGVNEPRTGGDRPGDRWAAATTWAELLTADGWALEGQHGTEDRWTRPGKSPRDGMSATTGHSEADTLHVFTSSAPGLDADANYSKLGYLAAMRFGGDTTAAARWLVVEGWGDPIVEYAEPASLVAPVVSVTETPPVAVDHLELAIQAEERRLTIQEEALRRHAARTATREIPPSVTAAELLAHPFEPIPWRVAGLMSEGDNLLIAAERKAGKTTFSLNLLRAITERSPFIGMATTPLVDGVIAYWDAELGARRFQRWLAEMAIDGPLERVTYRDLRSTPFPSIYDDKVADDVARQLADEGCRIWVVDPAVHAISRWPTRAPNPESDNVAVHQFTARLDEIKVAAGVGELIVVHHAGKDGTGRGRGASRWEDWPDVFVHLHRGQAETHFDARGRDVEIEKTDLAYNQSTHRLTVAPPGFVAAVAAVVKAIDDAGGRVEGRVSMREALSDTAAGGDKSARDAHIDMAVEAGKVKRIMGGERGTQFVFILPSPPEGVDPAELVD